MSAPESAAVTPGQAATVVASPNKPRPDDPLALSVADMLRRIEINYDREGSGPGSRFEGQLLEDVQARAVIELVAARQPQPAPGDEAALTVDDFYAERAERLHRTGERDAARSDLARVKRAVLNPGTHQAKIRKILAIVDPIPGDEPQPDSDAQPAPELAAARPDLGTAWRLLEELRERIAALAAHLEHSAAATAPSKKSAIEQDLAGRLRKTLPPAAERVAVDRHLL